MLIVGVMVVVESGSDESWRVLKRGRTHQLQHWVGGKEGELHPHPLCDELKTALQWL